MTIGEPDDEEAGETDGTAVRFPPEEGDARVARALEGDVITPARGEEPRTLEAVIARIQSREDLTVARRRGEIWVDLALPEQAATAQESE